MRFIIGTSYFNGPNSGSDWFFQKLWFPCALKASKPSCEIVCISVAGTEPDALPGVLHIDLAGDLGHVHQMIGKKEPAKNNELTSWDASVLTLAMTAYTNEADFIFFEQDCLAFGDWVGQLYKELEESGKEMLFGRSKCMPCAQSLFIIKHRFIPRFVAEYIMAGYTHRLGEDKFIHIENTHRPFIGRFSFGYDRDRPLNMDDAVWYGQKFSREELNEMRIRGLIDFEGLPDGVGKFTNDC